MPDMICFLIYGTHKVVIKRSAHTLKRQIA